MFHFYSFPADKKIIISDLPIEKIKEKFGHKFEIITSVKEKESIEIIKPKILKGHLNFIIEERFVKIRNKYPEEGKRKISESKIGKPRDEKTKAKISNTMKGRSNFQGKTHTPETKAIMAQRKMGNKHVRDTIWAHDPRSSEEVRVGSLSDIPKGFSKGRDYYSTEPGLFYFKKKIKS